MKKIVFALLIAALLSVAVVPPAFAQGGDEGRVIFGQDYTVNPARNWRVIWSSSAAILPWRPRG